MAPIKSVLARVVRTGSAQARINTNRGITNTAKKSLLTTISPNNRLSPTPFGSRFPAQPPTSQTQPLRTPVVDFDTLARSIKQSLDTTPKPDLPFLHNLLRRYTSSSSQWLQFAHTNPAKPYTRNLVCQSPNKFNLLILVWTPGRASPIHDHSDSHCIMKVLKGSLVEKRYKAPRLRDGCEGPMAETLRTEVKQDKIAYINDSMGLHEISNPSPTEYAVSLHLYTPPNAALRGCYTYDVSTGESKHVMQSPYDSEYGVSTIATW